MKTQPDLTKATPRPWTAKLGLYDHANDGSRPIMRYEEDNGRRLAVVDSIAPRTRKTAYDAPDPERDANAALIVQAVNEYDVLNAVADAASHPSLSMEGLSIPADNLRKALAALATLRQK